MPATALLLSQTLVVDASGAGDFTTIQAAADAADAAAPGDVLLVQPGGYDAFVATKAPSILGPAAGPAPVVGGMSTVDAALGVLLGAAAPAAFPLVPGTLDPTAIQVTNPVTLVVRF